MHGSESPSLTLTSEEREALFREYHEWLRAARAGGGLKKCHLPAETDADSDGNDGDNPRPLCDRPLPVVQWVRKDPACFPPVWADLCADCGEIVATDE